MFHDASGPPTVVDAARPELSSGTIVGRGRFAVYQELRSPAS
jgi:hypothetical protein